MKKTPINIDVEIEEGNIYGYVTYTNEVQLRNYLEEQGHSENVAMIANKYSKIAILKNLYVHEDSRGEGIGNQLLDNFIDDSINNKSEAILLIADTIEHNEFSLVEWYEGWGFEIIDGERGYCPLMILDKRV